MKPSLNLRLPDCLALLSVIALVLMIIFPAASTARSSGKSTLCLANLHILGRAWLAYQEDNHDKLVNGLVPRDANYANSAFWRTTATFGGPYKDNAWWVNPPHKSDGTYAGGASDAFVCSLADEDNGIRSGRLFPYVGTSAAYHCPSDLSYLRTSQRGGKRSYMITDLMHGERPNDPQCADLCSQIVRPSDKMVFVENYDTRGWLMGSWMMGYSQYSSPSWIDMITVFHDRRSALGFADGHGEFHRWQNFINVAGEVVVQPTVSADLYYLSGIYLPKK